MTDNSPEARAVRRRWVNLGEFVAVSGLIISGLALWNSWGGDKDAKPTVVEEKAHAIPLALRGKVGDEGRTLTLTPVESSHALDSATLSANGKEVEVGSDGGLTSADVQALVATPAKDQKGGALTVNVKARYIEAGEDKPGSGRYRISYRWTDGGLFNGRELRITGFSRG